MAHKIPSFRWRGEPAAQNHCLAIRKRAGAPFLTPSQLSSEYGVHATQINTWKQQAREKLPELFGRAGGMSEKHWETEQDRLYQQIGRLQVGVDGLRKKSKALGLT